MIKQKKIFIMFGEVSGDMHAGYLCRELLSKNTENNITISGIGGHAMQTA